MEISRSRPTGEEESYPAMTQELFEFILDMFPRSLMWEESENETDKKFKNICGKVKRVFPDYCRDHESWVKSAHYILFYEFLKTLMENPKIFTHARELALSLLFDRFSTAIDRAEEEMKRKIAV